jgi:hypothetical protein
MTIYKIQLLRGTVVVETYPADTIDVYVVAMRADELLAGNRLGANKWRIVNQIGKAVRTSDDPPFA